MPPAWDACTHRALSHPRPTPGAHGPQLTLPRLFVPTPVLHGRVRIRDWREERPRKQEEPEAKRRPSSDTFKTRICWFFAHHPDGCVLPADCCPFAHGPGELRPAPRTKKKKPAL